ncbi:MAG: tyrosine-type recombinase/integrase, partial [Terracoccus sp.]
AVPPGGDALLFTGERGATPRRGNWRANVGWREALAVAGLPEGFHFHDLRHTGNHLVAQSGASTRELMQRMGHSTMRAALIYQHATESRSRDLAARLNLLVTNELEAAQNEAGADE